ncbi:MAG: glycosyltransferase 87 family protein [Myxococcota bacterium]|nr:glycosyltransferase 87 family protein [Myxococcota bacterium]
MEPGHPRAVNGGGRVNVDAVIVWLEWIVLCALVLFFVWRTLLPAWARLNTDFPNYYLAGRLYRDGYPLDRIFEWVWFQRQKDHAGIDWGLVGWGPLSPFSALLIAPFTSLAPLAAKRCWLVVSTLCLVITIGLLRKVCRLSTPRIGILVFVSVVPLRTNFEFGQQYVFILFLLATAAWLYAQSRTLACAAVLALATALKLYPGILVIFLLRKRRWRAAGMFFATLGGIVLLGVALFGLDTLKVYAASVLPRALAGEIQDPYHLGNNSLTVLLRRLFVAEPELNPRPLADAAIAYVVLQPVVQATIFVSALWFIAPGRQSRSTEMLQWGAFVTLPLVLSSAVSTYHLCPLILATALATNSLLELGRTRLALIFIALHVLVCVPFYRFAPESPSGWRILLGVPRLYALLAYWGTFIWMLALVSDRSLRPRWEGSVFALAFLFLAIRGAVSNARHFAGLGETYSRRLSAATAALVATEPAVGKAGTYFSRMDTDAYLLDHTGERLLTRAPPGTDFFRPALGPTGEDGWVEIASRTSRIVRFPLEARNISAADLPIEIEDAEEPAVSADGRWLGFLRETRGRASLWISDRLVPTVTAARSHVERQLLDAAYDVVDFAFFPDGRIVLAARCDQGFGLFVSNPTRGGAAELTTSGASARFPSVSPDGRWLAYGRLEHGVWQLWVLDLGDGTQHALTHADCNSTMPAWKADSTTIVYASDCGRGFGASALCQVRVFD